MECFYPYSTPVWVFLIEPEHHKQISAPTDNLLLPAISQEYTNIVRIMLKNVKNKIIMPLPFPTWPFIDEVTSSKLTTSLRNDATLMLWTVPAKIVKPKAKPCRAHCKSNRRCYPSNNSIGKFVASMCRFYIFQQRKLIQATSR